MLQTKKSTITGEVVLTHVHPLRVRFNEADSLGIVWHGHYIAYFEEGREAFGRAFNLDYLYIHSQEYTVPIVRSVCNYKRPLRYGDEVLVETTWVYSPAAKILFRYRILDQNGNIICTGETIQVFLNRENELVLNFPAFYEQWIKDRGLMI